MAGDAKEGCATIGAMMGERRFGDAGTRVLIEECLTGTECSLHALVDGHSYRMLATARDHKRAHDGDAGPNTGGMGAFDSWIRTTEGVSQQIYSLPPLAAWVSLRSSVRSPSNSQRF